MRRKSLGNGFVKKCIVWAMTFMMICSPMVGSMGTMTVYAADKIDTSVGSDAVEPVAEVEETDVSAEGAESSAEAEETNEIVNELADDIAEAVTPVSVVTNADAALEHVDTVFVEVTDAIPVSTDEAGNTVISEESVIGGAKATAEAAANKSDEIVSKVDEIVENVLNGTGDKSLEEAKKTISEAKESAQGKLDVAREAEENASKAYDEAKDKAYEAETILNILISYQQNPESLEKMLEEANDQVEAKVKELLNLKENGIAGNELEQKIEEAKNELAAAESEEEAAQQAVEVAEAEKTQAEEVVQIIDEVKERVEKETGDIIDVVDAKESIKNSFETLEDAADPEIQEAAKEKINSLSDTIEEEKRKRDVVNVALEAAKKAVSIVREALQSAQNNVAKLNVYDKWMQDEEKFKENKSDYAYWNEILNNNEQKTLVYAQKDDEGNVVWENHKAFDTANSEVKPRPIVNFVEVSDGSVRSIKNADIEIPESVMIAYVDYMSNTSGTKGTGIATGAYEIVKGESATMPVVYWKVNEAEENKIYRLTGAPIENINELEDGVTYFRGYTFKKEPDGYHIDGYLFEHNSKDRNVIFRAPSNTTEPTEPTQPTPSTNPDPDPEPDTDPIPGGDATPDDVVTIEDAPVALAAAPAVAPVEAAEADDAAVLGARRVDANTTDAAVLGAKRGTEFAVLGKRRRPQTGDNAAIWVWASMITLAVCGAGVSVTGLTKNKRKKEEPGK